MGSRLLQPRELACVTNQSKSLGMTEARYDGRNPPSSAALDAVRESPCRPHALGKAGQSAGTAFTLESNRASTRNSSPIVLLRRFRGTCHTSLDNRIVKRFPFERFVRTPSAIYASVRCRISSHHTCWRLEYHRHRHHHVQGLHPTILCRHPQAGR